MITIERQVHFGYGRRGRKQIQHGEPTAMEASGRIPRVARIMALAIRLEGLIRDGVVKDQAELARLGHVSRARLTQIMNLLFLAPEIQEEILFLPPIASGRNQLLEKHLRKIAAGASWQKQRRMWVTLQAPDYNRPPKTTPVEY